MQGWRVQGVKHMSREAAIRPKDRAPGLNAAPLRSEAKTLTHRTTEVVGAGWHRSRGPESVCRSRKQDLKRHNAHNTNSAVKLRSAAKVWDRKTGNKALCRRSGGFVTRRQPGDLVHMTRGGAAGEQESFRNVAECRPLRSGAECRYTSCGTQPSKDRGHRAVPGEYAVPWMLRWISEWNAVTEGVRSIWAGENEGVRSDSEDAAVTDTQDEARRYGARRFAKTSCREGSARYAEDAERPPGEAATRAWRLLPGLDNDLRVAIAPGQSI